MTQKLRTNTQIRVPQVRLIDENDEQLGIVSTADALRMAQERGLDLAEVSPNANPPVCKIMDYGKYLYHQKKILQKHQAHHKSETKGIRLSFRVSDHDMQTKANQARKFIEKDDRVKVTLIFKGREMSHYSLGMEKLNAFAKMLEDIAKVDQAPTKQGHMVSMVLKPNK